MVLTPRSGIVALVGSGEFLPPIAPLDRALIDRLGGTARVAVVPTASAPDGSATFQRWLQLGLEHFRGLGCEVEPISVVSRSDADDAALAAKVDQTNFVYLSGGKPRYLYDTLLGTKVWDAIERVHGRGGVVAGCSAGAMVLAGEMVAFPDRTRTVPGLGLVPGVMVLPHFDEFRFDRSFIPELTSSGVAVAGVDGSTALVVTGPTWEVLGRGGVTIFNGGGQRRYEEGEVIAR